VTTGIATGPRTATRFFDIPVSGARVVFVQDCSQSMWGPKIETARTELEAAVKGLRSSQRFGVVFFNEKVWTWRDELVPATPAMKWDLCRRIPDLPTRSYTNIHDALERAFAWAGAGRWAVAEPPGLDEVFFLTDGEPNRGRTRDADQIAEAVRGWNARARVRVHTVALGERPAVPLLLRIAEESGGTYVKR
jgi:Ca-activated chloride channel family protein